MMIPQINLAFHLKLSGFNVISVSVGCLVGTEANLHLIKTKHILLSSQKANYQKSSSTILNSQAIISLCIKTSLDVKEKS
uniref:Hydroxyethylthiazole kinase n=1 Tax=Rhabditophanes sp. KR3021 TaxID=114890 RepID=A0AC35UIQ8_9BILA